MWSQETEMTDPIIIVVTTFLEREHIRRNIRLTSWLLILAAESKYVNRGNYIIPKCVT